MGQQSKPVTIMANTTPETTRVTLKGMVEPPAGAPAMPLEPQKTPNPQKPVAPADKMNRAAYLRLLPSGRFLQEDRSLHRSELASGAWNF